MATIETKDIVKDFELGETTLNVLKGISITVQKGEMLAIVGASGSGKSTLMTILGCLDTPTSGTVLLDGQNVGNMTSDERAMVRNKKIGFVFQKFNLLTSITALENVALPKLYAGVKEKQAKQEALSQLDIVGLKDWATHFPYQLSGGQQQRVAIARALSNNPAILFADEPTGNLDSETGKEIIELFKNINAKQKTTVIIVTHDPKVAKVAPRIVEIEDGKVVSDKKR
ncbi:ABC transporter ATP-binding protein [Candidatus Dependentiae bacterium]